MDAMHSTTAESTSKPFSWPRDQVAQLIDLMCLDLLQGTSKNRCASENSVPRTTAQVWLRNRARLEKECGLDPAVVEFFRITPRARVPT